MELSHGPEARACHSRSQIAAVHGENMAVGGFAGPRGFPFADKPVSGDATRALASIVRTLAFCAALHGCAKRNERDEGCKRGFVRYRDIA